MENNTNIQIDNNLKETLNNLANERNTDINTVIKLLMVENEELKKAPNNYLTTTKISKNKSTYSTVIPAPVKNKLGLEPKQLLYWDINENKIIITPEVNPVSTPEEESITAGYEILKDFLINGNNQYSTIAKDILNILNNKGFDKRRKLRKLKNHKLRLTPSYKLVVSYLLDYPLTPENNEILKEIYEEINNTTIE